MTWGETTGNNWQEKIKPYVAIFALITLSLVAYHNIFSNSFTNWDDPILITNNKFIRSINPINVFREFHLVYPPLNILSHAIDYHFWGLNPFGYHLTNLVFQILNTILVFIIVNLIFQNMRIAIFTGLLFAVHPIHVESVTWLSSRKDVLSMFFFLLSFLCYVKNTNSARTIRFIYFLSSMIFFAFSLLSKLIAISLPLIMIFYDFLIDRKKLCGKTLFNKIPFFIIIGAVFAIGFLTGSIKEGIDNYPGGNFYLTMLTIARVIVEYITMLLLPMNLNASYVVPMAKSLFETRVLLSVGILILLFFLMIKSYNRSKITTFGLAWFFITLLPVSNIIPISIIKADRYLYLPSIGFCLLLAYLLVEMASLNVKLSHKTLNLLSILILVTILSTYTLLCIKRNTVWRNSQTLWEDVIRKSPNNYLAHNNLGIAYDMHGLFDRAIAEYKEAIRIKPTFANAHTNLGTTYLRKGNYSAAIKEYEKAIELSSDSIYLGRVYNNLGTAYQLKGKYEEAIKAYRRALHLNPAYLDDSEILCNLGNAYNQQGLFDKAIDMYKKALKVESDCIKAYLNLGNVYVGQGLLGKAINMYKKALDISPNSMNIRNNLGNAYAAQGLWDKAICEYKKALKIDPTYAKIYYNLGNAFAKKGLSSEAIRYYRLFLKYWGGDERYRLIVKEKIQRLLNS